MTKQQKQERRAGRQRKAIERQQTSEKLWQKYMTGFFNSAYHRNIANAGKHSAA